MTAHTNRIFRHTRISGTKGEIIGEGGTFKLKIFAGKKTKYGFGIIESIGHVSGDIGVIRDFVKLLETGKLTSRISLMSETMESHLVAFAAEESRKTGKPIDMANFKK